jgi:DNA polymerase-3 subunit alpha
MLSALEVKTSYSILNSLNNIQKLVELAKKYGYTSLAITDEDNMFGVMEFYNECNKNNIKPIIGITLTIDGTKILLYAKNELGYKNLIKLSTIVSSEELTIDILKQYKDDLILIMPLFSYKEEIYKIYKDRFIGYTNKEELKNVIENPVLITNVSYLNKNDYEYLGYANMIKEGKILGEYPLDSHKDNHLLTKEEFANLVNDEVLKNMAYIIANSNVSLTYKEGLLPIYDEKIDSKKYLSELSHKGLKKRLNNNVKPEYIDRLEYELNVINKMGFNDYFLIVYDYVLYAKKHDILVGPGRGSAAGSLVSYTLGITDIDPIKYNLLFERFLNPERVTMPDIDIDFDALKRQDVIDYVIGKYGLKKVVGIITFNTLGAKQVIRDVGRVLNLSPRLIDSLAKSCYNDLASSYEGSKNFKKLVDSNSDLKKLYKISLHLEGLHRHVSVHAAGVVMSKYDIDETIPLYKNSIGMYLSAYSKDYLEPLGLLKMDFLGISNLTLIDEVINNIRKDTGLNITFANIPLDDKETFNLFAKGETEGIFQFEAPGMIKFLKELKVNSFNDIVAATSLYRPGPMDSIPEYLKRRSGKVAVDYLDPSLTDILKETYGIIIYQEQIMQIAVKMAGYTLGEADNLRRAISKKKEEVLIHEKEKFISGSIKNGYSKEIATKIYDLILKFANYGFNKSHAVSYAMIAYKMAFLKTHFYSYFMLSLLSSAISNENKTSNYISKLRQNNVKVLLPDINLSSQTYIISNKNIICPLSLIRNVGTSVTSIILKEREKGSYKSFIDFARRTVNKGINRKVLEFLILSGSFDNMKYNRRTLMNNLDDIMNYAALYDENSLVEIEEPLITEMAEYTKEELVNIEFDTFGIYLSNHPVTKYKESNSLSTLNMEKYNNKYIELVLEVMNIKEIFTKNNDVMAFLRASDEYKQIDVTVFPDLYKINKNLEKHDIIKITGKVEKRMDDYQLIASKIVNLTRVDV